MVGQFSVLELTSNKNEKYSFSVIFRACVTNWSWPSQALLTGISCWLNISREQRFTGSVCFHRSRSQVLSVHGHNCPISGDSGSGANSGNHSQLGLGLTTGMSWLHDGLIAAHHHILICHSGDSKSEELCVSCWEESRLRDARTHNSVAHIIAIRGFHSVPFHFMLQYCWDFKRAAGCWKISLILIYTLHVASCNVAEKSSTLSECKDHANDWIEY